MSRGHGHVMLTCVCVMDPLRPIMYVIIILTPSYVVDTSVYFEV